jgi:hypothetical protein
VGEMPDLVQHAQARGYAARESTHIDKTERIAAEADVRSCPRILTA